MVNRILHREEVVALIEQGRTLVLAASQPELLGLPQGQWIGGIATHFLTEHGPRELQQGIHVIDLTDFIVAPRIQAYQSLSLDDLYVNTPSEGFTYAIMPGYTEVHRLFALYSYSTPSAADVPLVGWVAGSGAGTTTTYETLVFNGATGEMLADTIVAMHCHLREGFTFHAQAYTPMLPDRQTEIHFPEYSFMVDGIVVNGNPWRIYDYLQDLHARGRYAIHLELDQTPHFIVPFTDPTTRMGFLSSPALPNVTYHESYLAPSSVDLCKSFLNAEPEGQEVFATTIGCYCLYESFACAKEENPVLPGIFAYGEICGVLRNNYLLRLSITTG
ncbi:MAG: hypothetical protein CSA97_02525 [Bacteroidetes bacterium]|nr:MAG: hypothetical protein CSA97_02525 [Bacteroidota bacterium]